MWSITIFVPETHAPAVREALAKSGGGSIGAYDSCSFSCRGTGRFRPLLGARPAIGTVGALEEVPEERIETIVRAEALQEVVAAVRRAHPYEEPAIHLTHVVDYKTMMPPIPPASASASAAAALVPHFPPCSIVVEGLDGVGKSTAARRLAARLGGTYLRTPPDSMRSFRSYFTGDGVATTPLREAYYMVGNFLAGAEMQAELAAGRPVVVDRYFASTHAYLLGKEAVLGTAGLPPPGNAAYAWPAELARPTHMVLLTLPEACRVARRASRAGEAETGEEALLRKRPDIPLHINEAYRRFGCTEVRLAAEDGVEAVVDAILRACGLTAS